MIFTHHLTNSHLLRFSVIILLLYGAQPGWSQSPQGTQSTPSQSNNLSFELSKRFQEGMTYYERDDMEIAVAIFRTILKNQPGHIESRLYLALSYNRLGEYNKSSQLFEQLRTANRLQPKHYLEAGYAMLQVNKFDAAIRLLREFPKTEPQYDIAMYYAGVSEIERQNYISAKAYLKQAVVLPEALANNKITLLKKINAHLQSTATKTPTPPKAAPNQPAAAIRPSPSLRTISTATSTSSPPSSLLKPLRQPQQQFYLRAWNDLYIPVYEPPQNVLFNYTLIEPGYGAEWKIAKFDGGLLGLGIDIGGRYSLEYFARENSRAVELATAHVDDHTLDTVMGKAGERHDNLSFFVGLRPILEWHKSQQFTGGLDGFVRVFYGTFKQSSFVAHVRASPYFYYLITPKILATLRFQTDHWSGLYHQSPASETTTTSDLASLLDWNTAFYGAAGQLVSQFNDQFTLKLSSAVKKLISTQKSAVAQHSIVGSIILEYSHIRPLKLQGGALVTRYSSYQIWPTQEPEPYQAHGNNLGLLAGVIFTPIDQLELTVSTVGSKLLWSPLSNLEISQWQNFAPTAQTHLHVKLKYSKAI